MPRKDTELLGAVRRRAAAAGLRGPAVARAEPAPGAEKAMSAWLAAGHHGELAYMSRLGSSRAGPRTWASWARSVALFADSYDFGNPAPTHPALAAISRYARGDDYHAVLKRKLAALCTLLEEAGFRARPFVDTSPLMERAFAAAGGLGWVGKNGNLLTRGHGSFFFLGGLVTDARWPPDEAVAESCGDCTACLSACPTGAIVSPGVVDARRCISYLTIELKGAIPVHLRPAIGNRVFGCDDCQEVCPWNEMAAAAPDPAYRARPGLEAPALIDLAHLTEQEFFDRFRNTPVRRARWRGLLRNVMVALGNWGSTEALPALRAGLANPEALVRQHAAWGVGRVGGREAARLLSEHLPGEEDATVRREVKDALDGLREQSPPDRAGGP